MTEQWQDMTPDVVGLGVSTLDIFTVVESFPTEREVQQAISMVIDGGGPVATAMVTLSRLGASAAMIDHIGGDWSGRLIADDYNKYGVATAAVTVFPGCSSSVANILVERMSGKRAILFQPGTVPEITDIRPYISLLQRAAILHINGRHRAVLDEAIAAARRAGVKVSFDGGANRYTPAMRDIVPQTDICIVAKDFAVQYTGETDLAVAAAHLLAAGPELVGITDGVNGSWIRHKDGTCFHQPAFLQEHVVDTTGCGDSYHGAFLYGLVKKMSLAQAAQLASAVAALNTQTLGGRVGLPDLAAAQAFLASDKA